MQLTKQTDFAFRTLIYLAQLPDGELAKIQDICTFYDVSPNHLSKVTLLLAKLGYVKSVRGKGGGICMAKSPQEINLGQVVRDVEPVLNVVNCYEPHCTIQTTCRLEGLLDKAMSAFLGVLDDYTLADVNNDELRGQVTESILRFVQP